MKGHSHSNQDAGAGTAPTSQALFWQIKNPAAGGSWEEFYKTYAPLIHTAARDAGLSGPDAEEVVQETMISVSKYILRYEDRPGECSFRTWLMRLARSRIVDHFRQSAKTQNVREILQVQLNATVERDWEREWQEEIADEVLCRVREFITPKTLEVYLLSVIEGRGPVETAKMLNMTRAAVYLRIFKVTRLLRREAEKLESARF